MVNIVGSVSQKVQSLLNISITGDTNIYIGNTNISHMMSSHPSDYTKYGHQLTNILTYPDYVGLNPNNNSLEYVKEYQIDNEFVKVAVRLSNGNKFYARSIYVLNNTRVHNFINCGTLKNIN